MNSSKQLTRQFIHCSRHQRLDRYATGTKYIASDLPRHSRAVHLVDCQRRWASSKHSETVVSDHQSHPTQVPEQQLLIKRIPVEKQDGWISHHDSAGWRKRNSHFTKHINSGHSYFTKYINPEQTEPKHDAMSAAAPHSNSLSLRSTTIGMHRAVVAFGSNLGDRIAHIENALDRMRSKGLTILKLSRLYETRPMYYENQSTFLNGAVLVETQLEPIALLDLLQSIENELGRVRNIEKGPRTLDLDIIFYNDEQIYHERLKVPHPLLREREFVLRPLADIMPHQVLPDTPREETSKFSVKPRPKASTIEVALQALPKSAPMHPITYLSPSLPFLQVQNTERKTHIMSILNITPDSFSDGGLLNPDDLTTITATVKSHIASGATILDIGGQSTRPHAQLLTPDQELARVLPVLRHIKTNIPEAQNIAISLDTFHAPVVRACAEENLIDIINDVSAGTLDPDMLRTAAEFKKTIVLMHMRGTPATMNKLTSYPDGFMSTVAKELGARVTAALEAGIPPWRIILDPGIGFAKNMDQNLLLLKAGVRVLRKQDTMLRYLPWLVGTSRKGFIGKITGVEEAGERVWGTAACVAFAVAGGADVVRVHDVREMAEVVRMADGVYRRMFKEENVPRVSEANGEIEG